jgi:hypothetical protein
MEDVRPQWKTSAHSERPSSSEDILPGFLKTIKLTSLNLSLFVAAQNRAK